MRTLILVLIGLIVFCGGVRWAYGSGVGTWHCSQANTNYEWGKISEVLNKAKGRFQITPGDFAELSCFDFKFGSSVSKRPGRLEKISRKRAQRAPAMTLEQYEKHIDRLDRMEPKVSR